MFVCVSQHKDLRCCHILCGANLRTHTRTHAHTHTHTQRQTHTRRCIGKLAIFLSFCTHAKHTHTAESIISHMLTPANKHTHIVYCVGVILCMHTNTHSDAQTHTRTHTHTPKQTQMQTQMPGAVVEVNTSSQPLNTNTNSHEANGRAAQSRYEDNMTPPA